jgi:XTP/dITP diphosphohydrolase
MRGAKAGGRTVVVATRNLGKIIELKELLADVPDLVLESMPATAPEVVEDKDTFRENAEKKAREIATALGMPALADDSGLEVDALGGAPGVFSARYAGPGASDASNNEKLLQALEDVPDAKRTARFRCVVAFADPSGTILFGDGTCEGTILRAPRGSGGFGYDPLFYSTELGATFAELGIGPKNHLSHRARAIAALKPELLAYFLRA